MTRYHPSLRQLFREIATEKRHQTGFLASGSSYRPPLPILLPDSGLPVAFVPGYSSATATDSHRASLDSETVRRSGAVCASLLSTELRFACDMA